MGTHEGGKTGATPASFCHSCGTKLSEPIGRFCANCGTTVGAAVEEPVAPRNRNRSRWWVFTGIVIAVALVAGAILLTAGSSGGSSPSSDDGGVAALPSPGDLPSQKVAIVSHVPIEIGTVSQIDLEHAIAQTAAAAGLDSPPKSGGPKYKEIEESALRTLMEAIWIRGEAAELGFEVTPSEISKERAKLERQNFKSDSQYRKFLAEDHYTEKDVRERVEIQILSGKIQEKVQEEIEPPTSAAIARYYADHRNVQFTDGSNPAHVLPLAAVRGQIHRQLKQEAEEKAITSYIRSYKARWRSRSVCAPEYVFEDCSNGPTPAEAQKLREEDPNGGLSHGP